MSHFVLLRHCDVENCDFVGQTMVYILAKNSSSCPHWGQMLKHRQEFSQLRSFDIAFLVLELVQIAKMNARSLSWAADVEHYTRKGLRHVARRRMQDHARKRVQEVSLQILVSESSSVNKGEEEVGRLGWYNGPAKQK